MKQWREATSDAIGGLYELHSLAEKRAIAQRAQIFSSRSASLATWDEAAQRFSFMQVS